MLEEEKESAYVEKQGFGQVSRRDYLKDAGLMVGAPTIDQQHPAAVLEAAKNL